MFLPGKRARRSSSGLARRLVFYNGFYLVLCVNCSLFCGHQSHCHNYVRFMACTISASEKLGFTVARVILEADGTEIDGDDEMMAFEGSTLLGLQEGESWMPGTAVSEPPPLAANSVSVESSSPQTPGELLLVFVTTVTQYSAHIYMLYAMRTPGPGRTMLNRV